MAIKYGMSLLMHLLLYLVQYANNVSCDGEKNETMMSLTSGTDKEGY